MQLGGIHHLTAVSAKPRDNLAFYTDLLGMRLVKKTVNQDDVSAYHLFYADGKANPGTDLTFFDFLAAPERRGTNAISRTGLRVAGEAAFGDWWRRGRPLRSPYFHEPKGILFDPPFLEPRHTRSVVYERLTDADQVEICQPPALLRIGNGRSGMWWRSLSSAQNSGSCLLM